MKKTLIIFFAMNLFGFPCFVAMGSHSLMPLSASPAANRNPAEVVRAAREGWQRYSQLIPRENPSEFGFNNLDEISLTVLGAPIEIYAFDPQLFDDVTVSDENVILFTEQWRIPVLVNGMFRAFVTVAMHNNQLAAVEFGACGLAAEMEGYHKWLASDQRLVLIRFYQMNVDFIGVKKAEEPLTSGQFQPLRSGQSFFQRMGITPQRSLSLRDLGQLIRSLKG